MTLDDDIADLRAALADLADGSSADASAMARLRAQCARVASASAPDAVARAKISADEMSAEVVDSNPYSRLMALQRMGIVTEYKQIRNKAVAVVGVGGVGSVAAEMLTRCGVGRLQLYDFDVVELANMNRLFFRPEHAGMTKTDAAVRTLRDINPDVEYESYHMNITTVDGFKAFSDSLKDPTTGESRVDLVLACVDNYEARMCVNQACLEMGQTWMESGVSEDAVSGHVQTMVPGETACFACVPPLVVASGIDEKTLKREGVCAASLPTTMGMVAGMLVQNSLKHMLRFGSVSKYLGYSALKDFFPTMEVRCNPDCDNGECRRRQEAHRARVTSPEYLAAAAAAAAAAEAEAAAEAAKPLHEENDWGISVDAAAGDDDGEAPAAPATASTGGQVLGEGIQFSMPASEKLDSATVDAYKVADTGAELDDLMSQLRGLSSDR